MLCCSSVISQQTLQSEFITLTAHNGLKHGENTDFCCESVDKYISAALDASNLIEIRLTNIHIIQFVWIKGCTGGKTALKRLSQCYSW